MKTLKLLTILLVTVVIGVTTVNAERGKRLGLDEEVKVREVVQHYFDKRYRSRKMNQLEDFRELTDQSMQANHFLKSEMEKLEVEIYNAKLNHLGYARYNFTLDFDTITFDEAKRTATVLLTESHDVVFEISEMTSKTEPVVSKMRNLSHTMVLKKKENGWKIVSDTYDDYLWRRLRATKFSKDELIQSMDEIEAQEKTTKAIQIMESAGFSCNLQEDATSFQYNRQGAVEYAREYALNPNPHYYFFPDNDCTNFISQALHHGGNAMEGGRNTWPTWGWYYSDWESGDYSPSWTDVQVMYDYIVVDYATIDFAPEGCDMGSSTLRADLGDIVQFEWGPEKEKPDDTVWDHAVMIVGKSSGGYGVSYYVSGHTDNIDNYPLNSITYQSRRFIHIERNDARSINYVPLVESDGISEYIVDTTFGNLAYPAPQGTEYADTGSTKEDSSGNSAYPAP